MARLEELFDEELLEWLTKLFEMGQGVIESQEFEETLNKLSPELRDKAKLAYGQWVVSLEQMVEVTSAVIAHCKNNALN